MFGPRSPNGLVPRAGRCPDGGAHHYPTQHRHSDLQDPTWNGSPRPCRSCSHGPSSCWGDADPIGTAHAQPGAGRARSAERGADGAAGPGVCHQGRDSPAMIGGSAPGTPSCAAPRAQLLITAWSGAVGRAGGTAPLTTTAAEPKPTACPTATSSLDLGWITSTMIAAGCAVSPPGGDAGVRPTAISQRSRHRSGSSAVQPLDERTTSQLFGDGGGEHLRGLDRDEVAEPRRRSPRGRRATRGGPGPGFRSRRGRTPA
jgi:hypothetical protein